MTTLDTVRRLSTSYALYVALGVVIGWVAAPAFAGAVRTDGPDPVVAVVPVEGTIDGATTARVTAALAEARASDHVEAVVLAVNSGGGEAAASEELYFEVKRTVQSGLPVTASVDAAAASGAYYAIAPADRIFVKPSSTLGSIGVVARLPSDVEPNDLVGSSGPNKLQGADTREFLYIIDSLQAGFVNAVMKQRGDRMDLSRAELEEARIYAGGQAVENGLADEIGDREAAVHAAAERAGLDRYRVRVLEPANGSVTYVSRAAYLASDERTKRLLPAERLLGNATGGPTFLMTGSAYLAGSDGVVSAAALDDAAVTDPPDDGTDETRNDSEATEPRTRGPAPDGTGSGASQSASPGSTPSVQVGRIDPVAGGANGGGRP